MVPDPQDPTCCEIPQCPLVTPTPRPGVSPTPGIINVGTLAPGKIVGVGKVPTPLPTAVPTPGPDGSTVTPTPVYGPDGSTITPTPVPTTGQWDEYAWCLGSCFSVQGLLVCFSTNKKVCCDCIC